MSSENIFPSQPSITLYDPLADLLGAGDGKFTYTFGDAVKLSGHACPTVAGAFLLVKVALDNLYPNGEIPVRGDITVEVAGGPSDGVNGPLSQVYTLITGASSAQGFHGLAGQYVRKDLLRFNVDGAGMVTFGRRDSGKKVTLAYSLASIPPKTEIGHMMGDILSGSASDEVKSHFAAGWRQRVLDILADGGNTTVQVV
ncbi:MAG: hypothetical protein HQL69_17115 [Magnetococcales bacterium]|nr:hypothetical protein [Magnetococcales bacterium]